MFTYGMLAGDRRRQARAIRAGATVVFGLRNEAYLGFRDWDHVSGVLTPSRYLADLYRADSGLEATALFAPLDPAEVVAAEREPGATDRRRRPVDGARDRGVDAGHPPAFEAGMARTERAGPGTVGGRE